jgi:hypothetical protein
MLVMFDSYLRNRCIRLRDLEVYVWMVSIIPGDQGMCGPP